MYNPITALKVLEPNNQGRDFVIGDLHGSLSAFKKLLQELNFDKDVDRIISVGDLVDRGPDSLGCLRLLCEPWFHAVLANHELMMVQAFKYREIERLWLHNGGNWGISALEDSRSLQGDASYSSYAASESIDLFKLLKHVQELPFLITIKRPDGKKFHVLHAELPPGRQNITDQTLSSSQAVFDLATAMVPDEAFLWSRFIFGQFTRADLSNAEKIKRTVAYMFNKTRMPFNDELSHIISGHTVVQRPLTIYGQTNLDTGAYGSYQTDASKWQALTCVELNTWRFYQATEKIFREIEPLTINEDITSHV